MFGQAGVFQAQTIGALAACNDIRRQNVFGQSNAQRSHCFMSIDNGLCRFRIPSNFNFFSSHESTMAFASNAGVKATARAVAAITNAVVAETMK